MHADDPHLISALTDREAWRDELEALEAELRPKELRRAELRGLIEGATRDIRRRMGFQPGDQDSSRRGRAPPIRPKSHPNAIQNPALRALAHAGPRGLDTKGLADLVGAKPASLNTCLTNFKNWGWITRPRGSAVITPAGIREAQNRSLLGGELQHSDPGADTY